MTRLAATPREASTLRFVAGRSSSAESGTGVVLAFPRVERSQADLLAAARVLIENAYGLTRSEAIARALVEADHLLEHLVVD